MTNDDDRYHLSRRDDPDESRWAAEKINLTPNRNYVIVAFNKIGAPMTDEELVTVYHTLSGLGIVGPQSDSGIRTRRGELVRMGILRQHPENGTTVSGNTARRWELNA